MKGQNKTQHQSEMLELFQNRRFSMNIGIDLGTTNSSAAIEINGKIKFLKFSKTDLLKSVIFYDGSNVFTGHEALQKGILNPEAVIKSAKTHMGKYQHKWKIYNKEFSPTQVATEILKEIHHKLYSFYHLSENESVEAVITVPAYFTSNQISETKQAGENAGFTVNHIITEPVAAAIAYGHSLETDETLFVFDLGGGTFDVSILIAQNSEKFYQTISIDGNHYLGGDNFDQKILQLLYEIIQSKYGLDLSSFQNDLFSDEIEFLKMNNLLLNEAINAKIALSDVEKYEIQISNFYRELNFEYVITRAEFEYICKGLFDQIKEITHRCLQNAKKTHHLEINQIDRVILCGGCSNMPKVHQIIQDVFQKKANTDHNLFKLVTEGATLYANKNNSLLKIDDVLSHSLGLKIHANNKYVFQKLLKKNSVYPCETTQVYTTYADNQPTIAIEIFEGENEEDAFKNEYYGNLLFDGIEIAKAGTPQIEISFKFDENRILTVSAKDLKTQVSKNVIINKNDLEFRKAELIDIMFVVDTTGSMDSYIKEILKTIREFLMIINEKNIECRMGIIYFGDETIGETPIFHPLTHDIEEFIIYLNNYIRFQGGDEPESSFEAIAKAIEKLNESNRQKIILLITDASAHAKEITGKGDHTVISIKEKIREHNTLLYCVSPDIHYYKEFSKISGGDFFKIEEYKKFVHIFKNVAHRISGIKKLNQEA